MFEEILNNIGFLISNILIPIFVFLIAVIIRHKSGLVWTSGADIFVFVTALQFAILFNMKDLAHRINPVFGGYFVETFTTLGVAGLVLLVWALVTEKEIEDFQIFEHCRVHGLELPYSAATYPWWKVFFFWSCALALISSNLYVLLGFGVS